MVGLFCSEVPSGKTSVDVAPEHKYVSWVFFCGQRAVWFWKWLLVALKYCLLAVIAARGGLHFLPSLGHFARAALLPQALVLPVFHTKCLLLSPLSLRYLGCDHPALHCDLLQPGWWIISERAKGTIMRSAFFPEVLALGSFSALNVVCFRVECRFF